MVDTFGQSNPLVAFKDSRPPSASGSRRNNGLKSASPPQMYTSEEAPMAAEEYTGTTTVNSSPCKVPNSGRSNGSSNSFPKVQNIANTNSNNNQRTASLLMRKKGLPWLLASAFVVIVVLLILCGFLLFVLYEHHGFHSQIDGTRPNSQVPQTQKLHQNSVDEAKTTPKWPKQSQKSMEVRFTRAAVLSENGICSEIGRKVLLQGGNAVDAALSVAFCVGALNPHSAGLGGGFLMTYYRRFYGKCTTIDARETAPARTNKDIFGNSSEEGGGGGSQYGKSYKSVATPGLLHGFWTAFKRFGSGKIAWMDLLMPTVHLLSDGFPVSELMAKNLEENRERIVNGSHSGMRSHFTNPATGQLYREGELIRDNANGSRRIYGDDDSQFVAVQSAEQWTKQRVVQFLPKSAKHCQHKLQQQSEDRKPFNEEKVRFTRAAVLSENGICSEIGRKVLLQGGNAVDAALSVAFCVGALNPHSAGLGGGFLMTYYRRFYGKCTTIDARETAPARTNKGIFGNSSEEGGGGGSSQYGYKSVATPGLLHGFWTAFKRFGSGKIAWMDLLMPTVHLLSDGFPVSELMAKNLEENRERIVNGSHSGMRSHFTNPATGQLYREGELIRDNILAETLKRLALSHEPLQLFYSANGDMAKLIADEFAANGGFITRKDLHTYRSVVDEQPLLVTSEAEPKFVLCGAKPSSSFAITQLILAVMLKFYPPGSNSSIPWLSDEYYHRLIESQKHAGGTSQVIVVDADGNAVSMTSSINKAFGSLIRSPQLGLIWNDHMDDFSQPNRTNFYGLAPSETNFIEAGKRPMSSMSPMVVYHKDSRKVKIVIGASGGTLIPTAMSQVLLQLLAFNHSLKEAIDTPRLHNQFTPFVTDFEREFPQFLVQSLRVRGHNMTTNSRNFSSSVQAILTDSEGNLVANNDFRRKVHTYPVGY
uniref:Gamma-glutamyltranspeptidase 1 n=1 Tax=Globodera pallida TaxID=36090 RepID=A0A183CG28_GLOPA